MRFYAAMTSLIATALFIGSASIGPVAAQEDYGSGYGPGDVPTYTKWQPGWDNYNYDRRHVMLGTVQHFSPYRLTLLRRNGVVQTVDLKNGTVIYPTGATPVPGERVSIVGYYSNGTFIVNRLIIHP